MGTESVQRWGQDLTTSQAPLESRVCTGTSGQGVQRTPSVGDEHPPEGGAVIAKALSQGRVRRVRGTARSPDPPQGGDSVARGPCEVWRPRGLGPCREGPAT